MNQQRKQGEQPEKAEEKPRTVAVWDEEEPDQDPGERQRENQNFEKDDPLAA